MSGAPQRNGGVPTLRTQGRGRGYNGNNGGGGGNGNGGGSDGWQGESAAQWEAQWRADVARQLQQSGQALQDTALTLERLGNRLDEHDRRIGELEASRKSEAASTLTQATGTPDRFRANIAILISGLSVGVYLFSIIAQHWH
jgi:hypothetical protein